MEAKTKVKFTTGPWKYQINREKESIKIFGKSKNPNKLCDKVAIVLGTKYPDVLNETAEANAQLIASAPELLFYMKDLIEQIDQFRDKATINTSYAQKAIDKAEGK